MAKIMFEGTDNNDFLNANPDKIFVFDNVLPKWLVDYGAEELQDFDWKYGQSSYPGGGNFFGKCLFDGFETEGNWPSIIKIALEGFKAYCIETEFEFEIDHCDKILVNGQLPNTPADPHMDTIKQFHWTLLYYCNDSDGGTEFYKSNKDLTLVKSVDFKQGRMVLFPSYYNHKGLCPTKKFRISFGYQMSARTPLNAPLAMASL